MAEEKYLRKVTEVDTAESVSDGDTLILIRSGKAMQVPVDEVGEKISTSEATDYVDSQDTIALIRSGVIMQVPATEVGEKITTASSVSSVTDSDKIPVVRSGEIKLTPVSEVGAKPAIYMYSSSDGNFYTDSQAMYGDKVTYSMMQEALKNGVVRYYKYNTCGLDGAIWNSGLGTILSYQFKDCNHTVYCNFAGETESYDIPY